MGCYHVRMYIEGAIPAGSAHRGTAEGARRLAERWREVARVDGKPTALVDLSRPGAEPSQDYGFVARHGVLVEVVPGSPGCEERSEP